jgi:hypothetical protein
LLLSTGLHNLRFLGIALDGLALGTAVVIATFFGPVLAVLVTRHVDGKRRVHERRLDIFRNLMASRRTLLSPDKVRALNLVEIDFYDKTDRGRSSRSYDAHQHPSPGAQRLE